jgi:branched-chain amino acid transport system substrate-binding protein
MSARMTPTMLLSAASLALIVSACGSSAPGSTPKGDIWIATDLPVAGADASSGLPAQNGANYAVTSTGTVKGYTLHIKNYDDSVNGKHDATKGAQNITDILSNKDIVGVVGPFNTGVAVAEIPVANRGGLAMISPSNTGECLTQPLSYCQTAYKYDPASLRPVCNNVIPCPPGKNNYFRIAAADTFQGPAMADFAFDTLGLKIVAVWDDQEPFGLGVANNFAKEFQKKGGTVVDRKGFDTSGTAAPDFHSWLASAKRDGAQGIYAGATSATYGCIPRAESKGIFDPNTTFYLGPDGIGDAQCLKDSGDQATDNMYASQGAADATQFPDAAATIAKYKAACTQDTCYGAYTYAAYDCAMLLINAISNAIQANGGNKPSRGEVIKALANISNYKGLTGTISFNNLGDPTAPVLQIDQNKGGTWVFMKQFAVGA